MNTAKNSRITKARNKLAAGVLLQARRDLRCYRDSRIAAEQGLYLDAYSWVVSDNQRWPFSFLNVCRRLKLEPGELRRELLDQNSLGALAYWNRRLGKQVRRLNLSFRHAVRRAGEVYETAAANLVHGLP